MELYGEGHYGLGNVKEIKVTRSYLNMDKAVTGCQNTESKDKCNSRRFLAGLQSLCGCVPLAAGEVGQAGVDLAKDYEILGYEETTYPESLWE